LISATAVITAVTIMGTITTGRRGGIVMFVMLVIIVAFGFVVRYVFCYFFVVFFLTAFFALGMAFRFFASAAH
ncbi:MAG TPA: hypothetical protein VE710_07575, partial [Candidatus Bathyarchaeia archaeon]|nr:hypothetical protein [Candidatus Bathyarchaeia archaeon]